MTGAHRDKVESVGLALCLSPDNGEWYFSFVSRAEYTVVRSVTQNPIILLSAVLAKSETNVGNTRAWLCCKIGKDWAHFRDFPIVAEQGNEAGNRIFCAKKT